MDRLYKARRDKIARIDWRSISCNGISNSSNESILIQRSTTLIIAIIKSPKSRINREIRSVDFAFVREGIEALLLLIQAILFFRAN